MVSNTDIVDASAQLMVLRFICETESPDDTTYDVLYIDRTTGQCVMRYDGADPANTNPSYGAIPDREALERLGYNLDEEIDIKLSVLPVDPAEVARLIRVKEARAERQKEEDESQDLLTFLGDEVSDFDFSSYHSGEQRILKPALEKRGYTNVSFYMGEQDSFGPLSRGVVAKDPEGKRVRFYYG